MSGIGARATTGVWRSALRRAGADGVYVAGYAIADNGARLIKDLRGQARARRPDPVARRLQRSPPLSWRAPAPRAEGVVITLAAIPTQKLPPAGLRFARGVRAALRRPAVLLLGVQRPGDARRPRRDRARRTARAPGCCATSCGTRVRAGLLGDFAIDRYGDTTLTDIAVYRVHGARLRLAAIIRPSADLLDRR